MKHFETENMNTRKVQVTSYEEKNENQNRINDIKKCQSIVGVLNYITNSVRFDIRYVANWLARKQLKLPSMITKLQRNY